MEKRNIIGTLLACIGSQMLTSCGDEIEVKNYGQKVEITNYSVVDKTQVDITMNIDKGEQYQSFSLTLEIYDISTNQEGAKPTSSIKVETTDERMQTITKRVELKEKSNSLIKAVIRTQRNEYTSNGIFVNLNSNLLIQIGVPQYAGDEDTMFLTDGIGCVMSKERNLVMKYTGTWPDGAYVTLNGNRVEAEVIEDKWDVKAERYAIIDLDGIEPGDYTVAVAKGDDKVECTGKLRILPWTANFENTDSYSKVGVYPYLLQTGKTAYLIGYDTMARINLVTMHFEEMESHNLHLTNMVACEGKAYAMSADKMYRYDEADGKWSEIADLPETEGKYDPHFFCTAKNIYYGAKRDIETGTMAETKYIYHYDLYSYSIESGEWKRVADAPFGAPTTGKCYDGDVAYLIFGNRDFWSYHESEGQWKREESIKVGPYYQEASSLMAYQGKIIKIDAEDRDIEEYDPKTKTWTMKGMYSSNSTSGARALFEYNGKIYFGPFSSSFYNTTDDFITIDPKL